ncbi:MAG: acetylornithine deacetylase [Actinobacteria bacterium]|nr:acetylornithine deacetylase [Actinomycetota bacterium]
MKDLRATTLAILDDLVAHPTVTSDSNLDLIDEAAARLENAGASLVTTYDEDGDKANLFATIGPEIDGGVVLSGHTDVVPADDGEWTSDPFAVTRRDDRLYGRGTADMKGFIACTLALAPVFAAASLRVPVHIALTFDEEVGFRGAPVLLDELGRTGPAPSAAIVGEPTCLRIVAAHKGCYEYTTTVTGVQGHGSTPDAAVNAVEYGARYICRLLELRAELAGRAPSDSPFEPRESTISVGTVTGGTARNIVAGSCSLQWELRPVQPADADLVRDDLAAFERELVAEMRRTHPDADVATVAVCEVDGLELVETSAAVELGRRLLDDAEEDVVSFGTEAGLYQQAGIPAIVCGPGSIDVAHKPDEFVSVEQLDRCLDMLHRLGDRLTEV